MRKKIFAISLIFIAVTACVNKKPDNRFIDFNSGWKFALDSAVDASSAGFDDSGWRTLNLPHDWSIELPFDTINGEGCTAYLPGGIGWYRKTFDVQAGKRVSVLFDGVYNHSEYWINGQKLGYHPYGYTPALFDLTPFLNAKGKDNVLAVKVDRTRFADSRWYPGSGIYRNVKLVVTGDVFIPVWGTFITTPEVSEVKATVRVVTKIKNAGGNDAEIKLVTRILNPEGKEVQKNETVLALEAGTEKNTSFEVIVSSPELWDISSPNLYTAVSRLELAGRVTDEYKTRFGIRSIRFDAEKGFFLNGKNMKIKGVCLHHDAGMTGAAVPKEVWRKRLQTLKEGGCNAIRSAHNPASEEFLDLCDEMGFLVQDEFFDEWDYPKDKRLNMWEQHDDYITRGLAEYFGEWAEHDLKITVLAHRNHPCIFQWSIGNEIEWTYPGNREATGFFNNINWSGNYFWSQPPHSPEKIRDTYLNFPHGEHRIENTAAKLAKWTRQMDTTRPVIANCILPSASFQTGYADALDIVGFSYRRVMYDYAKQYFPEKVVMGTENLPQWHEWKAIQERDNISGTFLWTGMDYMGEAHYRGSGQRRRGAQSGLIDFAGFPKPSWYMFKSLWSDEPTLFISTQTIQKSLYKAENGMLKERKKDGWQHALWFWHDVNLHWNYSTGDSIVVEIISNLPELELSLNGKSLGVKKLASFDDHLYKWLVPFEVGELLAKGTFNGKQVTSVLKTAGPPVSVSVEADKQKLTADGRDVAEIVVQLLDENGNPVMHREEAVEFEITGPVKMLGVDNGDTFSFQPYQSNRIKTHNGRAKLMIQSTKSAGEAVIKIAGKNPGTESLRIEIR